MDITGSEMEPKTERPVLLGFTKELRKSGVAAVVLEADAELCGGFSRADPNAYLYVYVDRPIDLFERSSVDGGVQLGKTWPEQPVGPLDTGHPAPGFTPQLHKNVILARANGTRRPS